MGYNLSKYVKCNASCEYQINGECNKIRIKLQKDEGYPPYCTDYEE